jgi:hypothetical protein
MSTRQFRPLTFFAAGILSVVLIVPVALAAGKRTNPTSKIYVAETKGDSHIDTGEKIEPLSVKSVYAAEGTLIETKNNSSDALVFSNGTALLVGANTRFEVKKFLQEPFTPNRNDLDVEPSISQTAIKVSQGSIGVCTARLVAGSSMVYTTPHCTINIRGHKVMIEVDANETRVSLLEGDVTVIGDGIGTGATLRAGQKATIRKPVLDQAAVVSVEPVNAEANTKADEQVSLACIARRTVYFEVADRPGQPGTAFDDAPDIRPVEVVPTSPPTQFTVSPARITP